MKKSDDSKMSYRKWKSVRTITRTTSLKPKIKQMMKNKNFVQKQKHLRSSGTSTTSTSKSWRSWKGDKSKSSVSLSESEKINLLQPWPKTTELSAWKGSVIHEVCVASGDRDYDDWKAWLSLCLEEQPDMDMLARAPDRRFQSIDAKLSNALRKVIDNAGDKSMQVKYDMSMKNQLYGWKER